MARDDGAAVNSRDRLVSGEDEPDEKQLESALRPANLDEFVGQKRVRQQLSLVLEASRLRGRSADHVLLSGPPGLGKTTLAMIIAEEMGAPLRISSGPAIQHAGDLAAILSSLTEGEVLFLDEIHRMSRPAEEMLYMAMEDFRVDIVVGKGAGATSIPLDLPPFTLVGATTRAGLLPGPLRDRFGFTAHLEFYETADLERVLAEFDVAAELAARWRAWLDDDGLWPRRTVLTHGELYPAHLLLDDSSRILSVLDWTTAGVGDPALDLMYQHLIAPPESFAATVRAYEELTGRHEPRLADRCEALVAAGPLNYALFALASGEPGHREAAAAQLRP